MFEVSAKRSVNADIRKNSKFIGSGLTLVRPISDSSVQASLVQQSNAYILKIENMHKKLEICTHACNMHLHNCPAPNNGCSRRMVDQF